MENRVSWSGSIEVTCRGNDYSRGYMQGSKLQHKIDAGIEHVLRQPEFRREQPWWLPYQLFRWLSKRKAYSLLSGPISRDYPGMAERLQGIADGAGIDVKTAYLVNAFEPLMSFISDTEVPPLGACSALAVGPQRTTRGEPVLVHNFDYETVVEPYIILRESRPIGGYRSVDMTLAPLCGSVTGMNEKGLVICNNYAYTKSKAQPSGTMTMLISETLAHCGNVAEALAHMTSRPRWGGGMLMLTDASGDMASLEISTTQHCVRRPAEGEQVLFHTNCYQTQEMKRVQLDKESVFAAEDHPLRGRRVLQSPEMRYVRLEHLLKQYGKMSMLDLVEIMSDHGPEGASGEDTVCVHGVRANTVASVQFWPKSRMMRVTAGSPCSRQYQLIGL